MREGVRITANSKKEFENLEKRMEALSGYSIECPSIIVESGPLDSVNIYPAPSFQIVEVAPITGGQRRSLFRASPKMVMIEIEGINYTINYQPE